MSRTAEHDAMVAAARSASVLDIVAARVALKRDGREWLGCCPFHADGTPSFYVVPHKGFYHCFGCQANGRAIDFVMAYDKVDFLEACRRISGWSVVKLLPHAPAPVTRDEQLKEKTRKLELAHEILRETVPADGTIVEQYLKGRSIHRRPPTCLRLHRSLYHKPSGKTTPAMVAVVRGADDKVCGIHRTWLRSDGSGKAGLSPAKMGLGNWVGGHIRLAVAGERLAVAEGIETALSVMQAQPGLPCWAAMSLGNLGAPVPDTVREVIICADNDSAEKDKEMHKGIVARAAAALRVKGRRVRVAYPPAGTDFNDWLCRLSA